MKEIRKNYILIFTLLITLILSFFPYHSSDIDAGEHWYGYPIPWFVIRGDGNISCLIINLLAGIGIIYWVFRLVAKIIKSLFINKRDN
jgi:hypothetical protein